MKKHVSVRDPDTISGLRAEACFYSSVGCQLHRFTLQDIRRCSPGFVFRKASSFELRRPWCNAFPTNGTKRTSDLKNDDRSTDPVVIPDRLSRLIAQIHTAVRSSVLVDIPAELASPRSIVQTVALVEGHPEVDE